VGKLLVPGERTAPGIFSGRYCPGCPCAGICHANGTAEACGDAAEYAAYDNALHPVRAWNTSPTEFEFPSTTWPPLPTLLDGVVVGDYLLPGTTVGIRLRESMKPSTWAKRSTCQTDAGMAVLLGKDMELERAWERSGRLPRQLQVLAVPLVISPGFSTWWRDPPMSALHAMARSAYFAVLFSRRLPTVPTLVWRFRGDLERWACWLTSSHAEAFCMDLAVRDRREQGWALRGVADLASMLGEGVATDMRLVAYGPSTRDRMLAVMDNWPGELTFVSSNPWRQAQAGNCLLPDLTYRLDARRSIRDVLHHNIEAFDRGVAGLLASRQHDRATTA
jgi:hypothetical protein